MTTTPPAARSVGDLLRDWRRLRRVSQLALSVETGISTRHLSFVETGRSRPSPEVILRLAEQLDVPLAERNTLLLAGGYAPVYPDHQPDDPALAPVLDAVRRILAGHGGCPALLVDRHWQLLEANPAVALLTRGAAPHLLAPPVNVLRLSLHPDGMAPRIRNLPDWRGHLLDRLRRQAAAANDPVLYELYDELRGYPGDFPGGSPGDSPGGDRRPRPDPVARVAVPLRYLHEGAELSFLSATTVFGTPLDVTVAGLAVEAFYPADAPTAEALAAFAAGEEAQEGTGGDAREAEARGVAGAGWCGGRACGFGCGAGEGAGAAGVGRTGA